MANAFSVPQSMGQYVEPININLVNAALSSKQQRYDYNVAKIDTLLQEFGNVDLIREEDKEYLADRIDVALSSVNQLQKRDLSSNNLTREIQQQLTTAIDDRVIEQVVNTKKIRNFEQTVAEKREKQPALYSDINYSFAKDQSGVNDYLAGQTDEFGNLQYVDYKDVNKKINDFIIDINSKKKDEIIQVPQTDSQGNIIPGALVEITKSGLNPTQVRQLAESQLDASYMQQVQINGWYNAGTYDNVDHIKSNVTELFDSKIKNLDAQTLTIQRKLANPETLSDSDRAAYESALTNQTGEKAMLEKNRDYLLNNAAAAATYVEKERILKGAIDAFGELYSETSKVVKDDVYFAQQDLNIKQLKLKHDIEKDAKETTAALITTTLPTATEDNLPEIEAYVDTSIDQYSKTVDSSISEYRAALQNEAQKGNQGAIALLDEYNKKLSTKKPNETANDVFSSLVSSIDYNSDLAIIGNKNYVSDIKDNKEKLNILLEGKNTAEQQGLVAHVDSTINSPAGLKAFHNNPQTKMLLNGRPTSVRQALQSNGIIDDRGNKIGDLKSNPTLLKELEKSYYADYLLSNKFTNLGTPESVIRITNREKEKISSLSALLGESFDSAARTITLANNAGTQYVINPDSKTGQYLSQARQAGIYDTFGWNDQSLSGDDATIGKFLRDDYKKNEVYKQNLNKFYSKLPTTQVVGVTAQDKGNYQRLAGLMSAQIGKIDNTSTINVRLDGENVILSQVQVGTVKGERTEQNSEVKILRNDFMKNLPELSQKLDFNTEASFYNIDKLEGRTLKSESIKFFDNSTSKKVYNYSAQVLLAQRPELVPFIDSTSAKTALYGRHKMLESKYKELPQIIDRALSQSSNFAINSKVERDFNGNPFVEMKLIDKRTQKTIHTISDSSQTNIEEFKKVLDNSPQVFYSIMINDILGREQQEMVIGSKTPSASFKNLTDSL